MNYFRPFEQMRLLEKTTLMLTKTTLHAYNSIGNYVFGVNIMKELNYKNIGERLKKLRLYLGLTQTQVANILNVGRDAILRIEKGERKIDLQELYNFSKLYNISIDELTSSEKKINNSEVAFARGYNELSEKDKREILGLIEYKNMLKMKEKNVSDDSGRISE